jgi:serine/threonine protein kinase
VTYYDICLKGIQIEKGLLIARNLCRAVAELHKLKIIHGDIASENVLVNPVTCEVKLIDFDLARKEGAKMIAGGNNDFVNEAMLNAITKQKQIIVSKKNDLYSLGLMCYLLIGDNKKKFFRSIISDDVMTPKDKEDMIKKETFSGVKYVISLIENKVTAADAAIWFDRRWKMEK